MFRADNNKVVNDSSNSGLEPVFFLRIENKN